MTLWIRAAIFFGLAPGIVAGLVPYALAAAESPARPALAVQLVGIAAAAAGGALLLWCFALFVRLGRGTPAPYDPPRRLVVSGPYHFMRNPMYVAVLMLVLGLAAATGSRIVAAYGVALATAFHLFVRFVEEPSLSRTFGEEYAAYRATVPRWLPWPRRRSAPPSTG